jgi:mycothiol synthase
VTRTGAPVDGLNAARIPGLQFRPFRDDRDYEALAELMTAANLADGVDYIPDAPSLRVEYENSEDFDVRRDLVIAEIDGRIVGYGEAKRQVRDGAPVYVSFGAVRPELRRRGLGRALLRWNQARSREVALLHPDEGDREFRSWIADRQGGARELLQRDGYVAVRHGFEMTRQDLGELPQTPLPDGLEIRPVVQEQLRTIFDAENEAFRDHWGHHEMGDADFRQTAESPDLDISLWRVAWDGDEVAGVVETVIFRSENAVLGKQRGWLDRISVRRRWRRRGLARALIVSASAGLRDVGMTEALLGVDAENPTGALQLYESLGFRITDRGTTFRKAW